MGQLHIVYDPKNRIQPPPADRRPHGISIATLMIESEPETPEEIKDMATKLVELLLENLPK